ncbi:nuclear transport factor 2 family protein [uncultured Aquimarina sp.]|uniref:nuclear transport factor 2 family protein n=1 Tax=uncultured Aquimarina sp. TaxID=575652 RepID=UPI002605D432|nr:nuclear transport factor 2 family protein [uncultured Aquimarina sp.]
MKYSKLLALCIITLLPMLVLSQEISKVDRAKNIVAAVNQKDAKLYIENFTKDVKIYMYGEDGTFDLKVDGIEALYKNRAAHLKKHPDVRNEIQHLAEIDNRLVMHDRVWLTPKHTTGSDIVEIFTFDESGKISRVDVIQQSNLFSQEQ